MSEYFLLQKPNKYKQYRETRRNGARPTGLIVVHTAENTPDTLGPDSGAENVASWIRDGRTDAGAYHRLVDSDSIIKMAPFAYEAWHCRITNNYSVGISAATRADSWNKLPAERRLAMLRNLAKAGAEAVQWAKKSLGIAVPPRWVARAEALAGKPGFIRHGDTDPGRRSDPWPADSNEALLFLDLVARELGLEQEPEPSPVPGVPTKTAEQIARDIIAGNGGWGNGTDRITRLTAAGYDAAHVQRLINQIMAKPGTAAPKPSTPTGTVLKRGSKGAKVGKLQRGLNRVFPAYRNSNRVLRKGHLLALDNDFGPVLESWVREFQRRTGLLQDGIVGPVTTRELAKYGITL